MSYLTTTSLDGGQTSIEEGAVADLASRISGGVLTQQSAGYDEARTIWNAMIDKRPELIARCRSADDVVAAVKFATDNGVLTAVRGGGHSVAGNAMSQGGLTIDLSPMKDVAIDDAGFVTVGPGCLLGELDAATQAQGRVIPGGIVSTTGVAGLTLGGGFGWLTRKYGMTIDSLVSVDMVLADGTQLTASETENQDLFWGIRGGGGNFGIVTSFKFKSYKFGPEVFCGLIVKPFAEAQQYLNFHASYVESMPDEISIWAVPRLAPPLPFLPEDVHGKRVLIIPFMHTGDQASGERLIQPVRDFGTNLGEHFGMAPFADWQSSFDGLQTPGFRNYWKSHNFSKLTEGLVDTILAAVESLPGPHTDALLFHLGGASSRIDPLATAYNYRKDPFLMNIHGRWEDAEDDERFVAWTRKLWENTKPYATGGVYVNFVSDEGKERVHDAYPAEVWNRLVELKRKYDPKNQFRLNQNIRPEQAPQAAG